MDTEDLIEVMKLLRSKVEQIDAGTDAPNDYVYGMVIGIEFALAMLDEKFGAALDGYEEQDEEAEA
jgi:hypothetical protein